MGSLRDEIAGKYFHDLYDRKHLGSLKGVPSAEGGCMSEQWKGPWKCEIHGNDVPIWTDAEGKHHCVTCVREVTPHDRRFISEQSIRADERRRLREGAKERIHKALLDKSWLETYCGPTGWADEYLNRILGAIFREEP